MRNLTEGNKVNFAVFTFIILIILIILVYSVVAVLRNEKEEYNVSNSACMYDKDYNYIDLEGDAVVSKKWTGNYYLKENGTKKEYNLGNYSVAFDKTKKTIDLFGNFYQVLRGGDVSKISGYNTINGQVESKFYKIDDRKYLIAAKNIKNDTGSLSTQNYLIIIVDKLGNALLLNNEIDAKTINEMIISTDDFDFDVANEVLMYNNESINLKKIIGSTNEYKPTEKTEEQNEEQTNETTIADASQGEGTTSSSYTSTTTTTNNGSTTLIQNGNGGTSSDSSGNSKQDTSWVSSLNDWIKDVASGFQSIYNGNSGKQDSSNLNRSITLNSLSADTTAIDINYTVTDPENKYNVVYATVSNGVDTYSISLDKNANTYKLSGLNPNTNYSVEIGYKIVYSDSSTEENVLDTMTVRTTVPTESLTITKVSLDKVYYTLKLDSDFVYDTGAKLVIYLNEETEYKTVNLTSSNLGVAASSGYSGSFDIPKEYRTENGSLKIKLENTKINGTTVNTNLMAKIINY